MQLFSRIAVASGRILYYSQRKMIGATCGVGLKEGVSAGCLSQINSPQTPSLTLRTVKW